MIGFSKIALATAILVVGATANAAERTPPRAPLDANGDGNVDFAELQARRSALTTEQFNAMDKDGNGQLSREEMRAAGRERMEARQQERFQALDANKDGGLSQQEIAAGRERAEAARFKKADTDGDGKLTQAELDAAREEMGQALRDRRGPGPGPGPRRGPPQAE